MYVIKNNAGNIYVFNEDNNQVNLKDIEVIQQIFDDNSLLSSEDTNIVNQILEYINKKMQICEETLVELPYYLTEEQIEKTKISLESSQ